MKIDLKNSTNVIHLVVRNNSDEQAKANLFYVTKNLFVDNFGSDEAISITPKEGQMFVEYKELLMSTILESFRTSTLNIISNDYDSLSNLRIMYGDRDSMSGHVFFKEIDMKKLVHEKKIFNEQTGNDHPICAVEESDIDFKIDYRHGIEMILPPNSEYELRFFVSEKSFPKSTNQNIDSSYNNKKMLEMNIHNTDKHHFYNLCFRSLLSKVDYHISDKTNSNKKQINGKDLLIEVEDFQDFLRTLKAMESNTILLDRIRFEIIQGNHPKMLVLEREDQDDLEKIMEHPIIGIPEQMNTQVCDVLFKSTFDESMVMKIIDINPKSQINIKFYFKFYSKK